MKSAFKKLHELELSFYEDRRRHWRIAAPAMYCRLKKEQELLKEKERQELEKERMKEDERVRREQQKIDEQKKKEEEYQELLKPRPIPEETRFAGTWIVAPPGRGKTTLLHSMLFEDFKKDCSIIIMDSKCDLINPIRELAFPERLVIIDPDNPIALNPLDVPKTNVKRAVSHLEYIFSALLEAKITPKQQALFPQRPARARHRL